MNMRTRMTAGTTTLIAILGITAVVGMNSSVPADFPPVSNPQHSTHGPIGEGQDVSSAATDPAAVPTDLPGAEAVEQETGVVQLSAIKPSTVTPSAPITPTPTTVVRDSSGKLVLNGVAGNRLEKPAPGNSAGAPGQETRVTPFPEVPSAGDKPGNGQGNGKPQTLGEALAKPHGIAAGGVSPAGEGVNKSTTKQAPGLLMRILARGEQDAGVNDAARTGGCAPGYGNGRSCLPVSPPSAAQHVGHGMKIAWTCEELLTLFPEGIPLQVRGTDPLRLDEDGNGIACA